MWVYKWELSTHGSSEPEQIVSQVLFVVLKSSLRALQAPTAFRNLEGTQLRALRAHRLKTCVL